MMALSKERDSATDRDIRRVKEKRGRDSVYLSVCCDDWESGARERVEAAMEIRRS